MELKIKYNSGTVIWAKTDRTYWPALILSPTLIQKQNKKQHFWVFWLGDYRISEVKQGNIVPFPNFFTNKNNIFSSHLEKKRKLGILEALRIYMNPDARFMKEAELIDWARNSFHGKKYRNTGGELPEFVLEKLRFLKNKENSPLKPIKNEVFLKKNKNNETLMCLGCYSTNICDIHPFFEGHLCINCKEKVITSFFNIGDDKVHYCCLICGNFEELIVCSYEVCGKGFCFNCIDNLASVEARNSFTRKSFWACFLCDPIPKKVNGKIKRRNNWRDIIFEIYNSKHFPIPHITIIKSKIRVLSLFDGIATGYAALKKLDMCVEVYYASEIDINCKNIIQKNYPNTIQYLGDIRDINAGTLCEIYPIDLLIGGSPCNELSLVNPNRKGLLDETGSGILFFEFYRILMEIKEKNNKPFFWLFENVASMTTYSKDLISSFFLSEPSLLNASWMSPQNRERYYWGNCPTLKCNFEAKGPNLQEYLEPGRSALVDKVQTITTRSNSLLQGTKKQFPIKNSHGKPDSLRINEIEHVFGFAKDYTSFEENSFTTRQILLGKSWSVQLTCRLLHFLKYFYLTEYENK